MRKKVILSASIVEQSWDDFLRAKVETARQSMRAHKGTSNDELEARFAARRAELIRALAVRTSADLCPPKPARESAP